VIDSSTLDRLEREYPQGLTSAEILELCAANGLSLSEATLRKYVQLGLLPRSVRVGRKGKHQGSQGVYPVTVLRQVVRIKDMLMRNYTIEQIQRDFLFVRRDLEQLEHTLQGVFTVFHQVLKGRDSTVPSATVTTDIAEAKHYGDELIARLLGIEAKLVTPKPAPEGMG
jgi:hypothetical protein